jgi:hypothetical protein
MRLPVEGSLLSHDFRHYGLPALGASVRMPSVRQFGLDRQRANATLGPTAGTALVLQTAALPLARWLDWSPGASQPASVTSGLWLLLTRAGVPPMGMLTMPWSREPSAATREVVRLALEQGMRFAMITNGRVLRLVDATRPSARGVLDFDLDSCQVDRQVLTTLYLLAGAVAVPSVQTIGTVLERAIEASDRAGARVCQSLRKGVRDALDGITRAIDGASRRAPRSRHGTRRDDEALTAVYRILFLLFAEARRLVPVWHPVYRDAYTLAALRSRLETRSSTRGTWAALQAIARLAHQGCAIGDLRVAPFNGRLFAPAHAPLLDHLRLDDGTVCAALASLVFVDGGREGRRRVAYEDLGVEQLGSIYEQLLDDPPEGDGWRSQSQRKVTGSFYTPAGLTDYLVRVTLEPLVRGKTVDEILSLRLVDPSMGSGAFLVAACRYLATACERAHLSAGGGPCDDDLRATWRRRAAQRCLFGVDANPMAVQLAQLSLWLATLAADRPLSFLDHHLLCGDSLIGASPFDVMRQPPGQGRSRRKAAPGPLEALFETIHEIAAVLPARLTIEAQADETASIVREKEQVLAGSKTLPGLVHWKAACDLWCSAWFPEAADIRALYPALLDQALGRTVALAKPTGAVAMERAKRIATERKCFHWTLEFPEVFHDGAGRAAPDGGFDAVVGNPPWEMLRVDHGPGAAAAVRFSRESGIYRAQSRGHANQYQLFVERALTLLRPGGRLGLLVPGGFLTDHGAAEIRTELLQRHGLESLLVFDNCKAIFPIHRGLRFAAVTAIARRPTSHVVCRFGLDTTDGLEHLRVESGRDFPIALTLEALRQFSGPQLAIPDLPATRDARLLEAISARHPALSDERGWGARFGRELNASDDKACWSDMHPRTLPVIEGKHLDPFVVHLGRVTKLASREAVRARLGSSAVFDRPRLAYREVAAATNRLTLIAAILPAGTISVHTVFCLRTELPVDEQNVLCALLNSFVANYLVRRWVTTHVTASIVERLPVPRLPRNTPQFDAIAAGAARLRAGERTRHLVADVHAQAARAYGINGDDYTYILDSFPLVPAAEREAALRAFTSGTLR